MPRKRSILPSFRSHLGIRRPKPQADPAVARLKSSLLSLFESFVKVPRESWSHPAPDPFQRTENVVSNETVDDDSGVSEVDEKILGYSGLLQRCALSGSLSEGKAVHGRMIKDVTNPNLLLWNSLLNVYAKCESLDYARRVLDEMPERCVTSWTTLISGFVDAGDGSSAVDLFREMQKEGIRPDECALTSGLKACSMCLDVHLGNQLHAQAIRVGAFSTIFVASSLVAVYAKCGKMELASKVFYCMRINNALSWTALLNGYAQAGDMDQVLDHFCRMARSGMKLSEYSMSAVLKSCTNSGCLSEGRMVHSLVIKTGLQLDGTLSCVLLDLYSKCGQPDDALQIFGMIKEPNVVVWSAMLNCINHCGQSQEAAYLFGDMRREGVRPNQFTLGSLVTIAATLGDRHYCESIHACPTSQNAILCGLDITCNQERSISKQMLVKAGISNVYTITSFLRSCSSVSTLSFGKQIHTHVLKFGLASHSLVGPALVRMYAQGRCLRYANAIFYGLADRDLYTWTTIIVGHVQINEGEMAVKIFKQMLLEGLKPNEFSISSCLSGCAKLSSLDSGWQLHCLTIKSGISGNVVVVNTLIYMYLEYDCIEDAETLFWDLTARDVYSWSTMISGYSKHGQGDKALEALRTMLYEGILPDETAFLSCIPGCASTEYLENGEQLHSLVIKFGFSGHTCVVDGLVDMYWKCHCAEDAESVFEGFTSRDVDLWNTMICGYSRHGMGEKALEALRIMLCEGILPNEFTLSSCVSGCAKTACPKSLRLLHSFALRSGCICDMHVSSALVDVYCKCRCTEEAAALFKSLPFRNPVPWSSIIYGYSQQGLGGKAFEAFRIMLSEGVMPNEVAFLGVLSACSQFALVEEGKELFNLMRDVYEITPTIEHCCIMAKCLFQAGKFSQLETFIEEAKLSEYPLIWKAVLLSCKAAGNVKLGEKAAKKLFDLERESPQNYVFLSQIFVANGRQGDAFKIRELMSGQGIKKEPGCSAVLLDGQPHVFFAQDCSHPKNKEIRRLLELISL